MVTHLVHDGHHDGGSTVVENREDLFPAAGCVGSLLLLARRRGRTGSAAEVGHGLFVVGAAFGLVGVNAGA